MKPIPLRPTHRFDSGHIFTSSNRCRMRELSHSDRFAKQLKSQQEKKVNVDVSMTSPMTPHDADLEQWQCVKWQ